MKYVIPFTLLLTSCAGQAKQTHLAVADAVSVSVNTIAPRIVDEYRLQLRTCRVEAAGDLFKYRLCAVKVDQNWEHFRSLYRNIRDLQDTYAKSLEAKDPNIVDYVSWLTTSWCQLTLAAPFKMPEVPGVKCSDE